MTWQPARTVFPDAELVVCSYLRDALAARTEPYTADVFVGNRVPTTRRDRMVTVRRDGGQSVDGVADTARLGINIWAATDQETADLARMVRALLVLAPNNGPILRTGDITGPHAVADESGQPNVYLALDINVRGQELTA